MRDMKESKEESVCFSKQKLEKNNWCFIELYHLNNNPKGKLVLYMNNKLIDEKDFSSYPYKFEYNENTIGCSLAAKGMHNFYGKMTALYFFETSNKTCNQIHDHLCNVLSQIKLEDLLNTTAPILEGVFMHINPKYDTVGSKRKIASLKEGKLEVYSAIEKIYEGTRIDHNVSAKNTFFAIGGIKTILPVLYQAAKHSTDIDFL